MTLRSSDTHAQLPLAVCLAVASGYLDGYGLLVLGTFVSFMSGNTTLTAVSTGQNSIRAALPSAIAVVSFVAGGFFGYLVYRLRNSHRLIFGLMAVLLGVAVVLDRDRALNGVQIALLSVATGMVNPAFSKIHAESVSLTFVTGTLSRMSSHIAAAAIREPLVDRQSPRDSHLSRARIDATIWAGFLIGALMSPVVISYFRAWSLLLPITVLLALALFSGADPPAAHEAGNSR